MERFEVPPDVAHQVEFGSATIGGKRMEKSSSPTFSNTPVVLRAAQYVRMSTEHQQYSPENQLEVIRQYAAAHQMEIVREYSDFGRSGLNIAGREGLNQLMWDVENKRADFSVLLVYDVSRWGRFQDVDESAYYEYVLKRAGMAACPLRFSKR
jgi:predicted site-specific integrase-resolvase